MEIPDGGVDRVGSGTVVVVISKTNKLFCKNMPTLSSDQVTVV